MTNDHQAKSATGISEAAVRPPVQLLLFVIGGAPNSQEAMSNLQALLDEASPPEFKVAKVDLATDPAAAQRHGIFMTPCLLKMTTNPPMRLVGNLSDLDRLRAFLRK